MLLLLQPEAKKTPVLGLARKLRVSVVKVDAARSRPGLTVQSSRIQTVFLR